MINYILNHFFHLNILLVLALGLNLINGFTGMFSLGHHGFFAVGAYSAGAFLLAVAPPEVTLASGVFYFAMSLLVGGLSATAFGLLVGVPCLRLKGDYLAIVTLGFGEIVRIIAQNTEAVGAARGLEIPYLLMPRNVDTQAQYSILYSALALVLFGVTAVTIRNTLGSAQGRAFVAIREDEVAAELLGVNLTRSKVLAFLMGSCFAGLAGALYVNYMTQIEPKEFNMLKGIYILLFVVLGGMGSLSGTVVAGVMLYILDKMLLNLMPQSIQTWREVFFALLLIVLMLSRPQGIFGHKELNQTRLWKALFSRPSASGSEGGR